MAYQLYGRGEGHFSGYYIRDQTILGSDPRDEELTRKERWNLQWEGRHEIDAEDLIQTSVSYLSDRLLSQDFSTFALDTFQQKSYFSYARRTSSHYLGVIAQDVETFDPETRQYLPSLRQLPEIDFTLSSFPLGRLFAPVYFGWNSSLVRSYERADYLSNSVDAFGNTFLINNINFRYRDSLNLTPTLTQTYTLPLYVPTQPSLSWSLALPANGYFKESEVAAADAGKPSARLDAAYQTSLTLINKWVNYQKTKPTHLVQSRATFGFSRNFTHLDDPNVAFAGVTSDRLGLGLDYFAGSVFTLQGETGYTFLPIPSLTSDWRQQHLEPLRINGRASPTPAYSLTWQGNYDWARETITSGFLSGQTFGKNWSLSASGSYSFRENASGQVFGSLNATYRPPIGLALQSSLQYDFTAQRLNNITVSLARDLHCWEIQAGYAHYFDFYGGRDEFGIGINLKAFPEVRVGAPPGGALQTGSSPGLY